MPFVEGRIFHRTMCARLQMSSRALLKARMGFLLLGKELCHRILHSKIQSSLCKVENLASGKAFLKLGPWLSQVGCWVLSGLPSQYLCLGHLSIAGSKWNPDCILRIQVWVWLLWAGWEKSNLLLLLAPILAAQWAKLCPKGRGCPPLVLHLGHGTG